MGFESYCGLIYFIITIIIIIIIIYLFSFLISSIDIGFFSTMGLVVFFIFFSTGLSWSHDLSCKSGRLTWVGLTFFMGLLFFLKRNFNLILNIIFYIKKNNSSTLQHILDQHLVVILKFVIKQEDILVF
jgi:hypothetical protein